MNRPRLLPAAALCWILLALPPGAPGSDRFDDIVVAPESLLSGETYHGYREFRIVLENQSTKRAHTVRLVFPEHSYGYGNSISRITRTVSLGPSSRAVVPLWQPPLPASGSGSIQVWVDDELAGSSRLPGNSQHVNRQGGGYGSSPEYPGTILVSRSFNYDDAGRALNAAASRNTFAASAATGPPDSGGAGYSTAAWMPEASGPGPHWLELEYAKPLAADRVRIYESMGMGSGGEIILTGVSGTNLARIPISPTGPPRGRRPGNMKEFTFPLTPEPVKTVRLEFGNGYGGAISVDAVGLTGPTDSVFATSARASSESSAPPPARAGMPGADARELLRAEVPAAEWSEYWLSYTPFDAIVVSAADLRAAPPAVQSALWCYAECGGNLCVLGGGEIPEPWRSLPKHPLEGGQRFSTGFGQCFVFESDRISDLKQEAIKTLMSAVNASTRYWQSLPDQNTANNNFPVTENVRIPIRGTVFVMLAFVIIIGPVNLVFLSRRNRRTWLLWTIPLISLSTCLMVLVYSLLREGITPNARIEGLTLLDQVSRRATTMGNTAFYCPLTPSQGLFFGSDTEATPLLETWDSGYRYGRYRSSGSGTTREMDWTRSQHLQRGWVTARVPAHFRLRKSETRRERLQLESAAGQVSVVNGLGAGIEWLWLADASGRIYTATRIPAGQKANLTASTEFPNVSEQSGLRSLYDKFGSSTAGGLLASNAPAYLLPNTYIAGLETNPFLENGLGPKAASSRTRTTCQVFGILEPAPRP